MSVKQYKPIRACSGLSREFPLGYHAQNALWLDAWEDPHMHGSPSTEVAFRAADAVTSLILFNLH